MLCDAPPMYTFTAQFNNMQTLRFKAELANTFSFTMSIVHSVDSKGHVLGLLVLVDFDPYCLFLFLEVCW